MDAVAGRVVAVLSDALAARGDASLVVPGGRTPIALFERLAQAALAWAHVQLTLTDERVVPVSEATSNERMVREHLLQGRAAGARFHPLMNGRPDSAERAREAWAQLQWLPRPFDLVVLGMGEDGHFASLFPQTDALRSALDPAAPPACVSTQAPVPPHARLSLNLAALIDARALFLPIVGASKLAVIERACSAGDALELPVRALLRQPHVPVQVFYAPA